MNDDVKALVKRALLIASDEGCVESGIIRTLCAEIDRLATALSKADAAGYARGVEEAARQGRLARDADREIIATAHALLTRPLPSNGECK